MKKITFYSNGGQRYAKVSGTSYRDSSGKIKKKNDGIYLGRVIDEKNNIFYSRDRGLFTYDPMTNAFSPVDDETYDTSLPQDSRKRLKICLDFGDSYMLHQLIETSGYSEVIDSLPYRNKDTLFSMLQYYVLHDKANDYAKIWYEGSIAKLLYPSANLTSQRISDFLRSIGKFENVQKFFKSHIEWVKKRCDDPAVIIDSTGLPNNIHFPLSAISNHNGKVSREARMTTVIQRDSGYPLMFRLVPGNVTDMSTITRSIMELGMHGIETDFVLIDSGYYTDDNIEDMHESNVDYLTRLPERNRKLYRSILDKHRDNLLHQENLVNYNGRVVYIKQSDCLVGKDNKYKGYAYLCFDVDRASEENKKALTKLANKKITETDFQKIIENAGYFILISSLPFKKEEILPVYYIRQLIEQYFDISKGSSKMTPLRVHSEEALYGHLILSLMAATINIMIMNQLKKYQENKEAMFMALRNQKCLVYKTVVNTFEPQATANEFYNKLEIKCPLYLERGTNGLVPRYKLPKKQVIND